MRAAVFLERDGILNLVTVQGNHQLAPRTVGEFKINAAAVEPLKLLKQSGYLLLVATNQPGISRGHISRREIDLMHLFLHRQLPIDDLFMCSHDEMDRCPCRKPRSGLLREAAFKHKLDLDRCFVVSDKWQDAQAAHSLGCTSLLLKSPWNGTGHRDFVLPSLDAIAAKIIQMQPNGKNPGQPVLA